MSFLNSAGNPQPIVVWWQGGALLDDSLEISSPEVTRNSLRLPRLTRADLLRKFTCLASNNNNTAPLSASVTIDLACEKITAFIVTALQSHCHQLLFGKIYLIAIYIGWMRDINIIDY